MYLFNLEVSDGPWYLILINSINLQDLFSICLYQYFSPTADNSIYQRHILALIVSIVIEGLQVLVVHVLLLKPTKRLKSVTLCNFCRYFSHF